MSSKKILIVNFGGMGDILNTTAIACHHKTVDPYVEVHFLTKSKYAHLIRNNTYIDNVIISSSEFDSWGSEIVSNYFKGKLSLDDYDIALFAAPYMSPLYDRTERSTLLNIIHEETSLIDKWSCEFKPYISLSKDEVIEADEFMALINGERRVLIEYEYFSNQSTMDINSIISICEKFNDPKYDLIFSGREKPKYLDTLSSKYDCRIHHYSKSFLSNAHLYNYMDLFIGCSSGITCLTASNYCNHNISRIEIVRGKHWSTSFWKHLCNKKIAYNNQDLNIFLEKY